MIFPHGMTLQMDTNGLFRHVSDMFYLSFGGWAPQAPTSAMAGCLVAHRAARNGALWTDEASQGATGSVSNQAFHGRFHGYFIEKVIDIDGYLPCFCDELGGFRMLAIGTGDFVGFTSETDPGQKVPAMACFASTGNQTGLGHSFYEKLYT